MLKRNFIALAIASVGMVGTANAAMYSKSPAPKACTGVDVTVPCESQGWDIGIQALYVQSLNGNQYWGVAGNPALNNWRILDADPEWDWGVRIEGSYHFNTGNDVNFNWTHFDSSTQRSTTNGAALAGLSAILTPFAQIGSPVPITVQASEFRYDNDTKFNSLNLELGQHVDFGDRKNIRFHGGVQFAHIEVANTWTVNGTQTIPSPAGPITNPAVFKLNDDSDFRGIGPRLGMDMSYDFGNGFSVLLNTSGEVLVGTLKTTTSLSHTVTITRPVPNGGTFDATGLYAAKTHKTAIVPGVEAKFGAKYTHAMAKGDLSIEGGWNFANYWDAVQSVVLRPGQHNFSYQGPYLGVKWVQA